MDKENLPWLALGSLIAMAAVALITRRWGQERKKQEQEAMEKLDAVVRESLEEDERHKQAMRKIQEEHEEWTRQFEEKSKEDMEKLKERISKITINYPHLFEES